MLAAVEGTLVAGPDVEPALVGELLGGRRRQIETERNRHRVLPGEQRGDAIVSAHCNAHTLDGGRQRTEGQTLRPARIGQPRARRIARPVQSSRIRTSGAATISMNAVAPSGARSDGVTRLPASRGELRSAGDRSVGLRIRVQPRRRPGAGAAGAAAAVCGCGAAIGAPVMCSIGGCASRV